MNWYHQRKAWPIVSIDTIGIGPLINRLKIKIFFLERKKKKKIIHQIFAVFGHGDEKKSNFYFIYL
jgi:hypothetical protein